MTIPLEELKEHLRIDESSEGTQDAILERYLEAAISAVEGHIHIPIDEAVDRFTGQPSKAVRQAVLLMVGNLYENREISTAGSNHYHVPYAYRYLLDPYVDYNPVLIKQ
jgi:uncharacterized phage protein (predicted DNA packaging)